ncbi:hypothetical protein RUND412_005709 [Rhizina undulata]
MPPSADIASFQNFLPSARKVLALCGAGLSAASGLPTFRGAGGLWRNFNAIDLATPDAFSRDPGLVWQFYSMRRHMALQAKPNAAHHALTAYALNNPNFITATQNVDGLSARAKHPSNQIHYLHGSLFRITCFTSGCTYTEDPNYSDPLVPALSVPEAKASVEARAPGADGNGALGYDEESELPILTLDVLPRCPECKGLLRPGVVWFNEMLDDGMLEELYSWIDAGDVDLCIVIGTSGLVYPAAGFASRVKDNGGKVALVDMDINSGAWAEEKDMFDWTFEGDAAKIVPEILKPVIGTFKVPET